MILEQLEEGVEVKDLQPVDLRLSVSLVEAGSLHYLTKFQASLILLK